MKDSPPIDSGSSHDTAPGPGASPDLVHPDQLPVRFGRYELRSLLGEGGMGRVFQARLEGPQGFRKELALKVVRARVAEQRGVRDAIVSEARIGGLLSHPHIVDVYDFGIEAGQPWIAMELVAGESLADRLRQGPIPGRDVLELLVALTRGLVHLHGLQVDGQPAGLVHRDLKPANVLLSPDGRIKITDFGLARAMEGPEAGTWSGAVRGTPAYMSPEQARGQPLDGRSDLFALGAIGFEAITGERLLQGNGMIEIMGALMRVEDRLHDVAEVDQAVPGLAEVLYACLRDDPSQRHASGSELLELLLGLRRSTSATLARTLKVRPVPRPTPHVTASAALVDVDGVFVGRRDERDRIKELLASGVRLVTIVGAGGTGKTRLARRVASERAARHPGGVFFADLTAATSVDGVCHAVATALGVGLDPGDPVGVLGGALQGRGRALLLLDNFEQVAAFAGDTVTRWLADASELVVVATSRTILRVAGERVLRLGPLPTAHDGPGPLRVESARGIPAVELFVVRATEANPAFALRGENVGDVVALVEALEGIPLAIELAAARARLLSPRRILERLPRRFDLLTTGRADVTARQATLRATVDWSWNLLEPYEQAALAQLSVFRGGFSLESAEEVLDTSAWPEAPWVMDIVQALADKSLLRVFEPEGLPGETRFAPYETIREYAADKLRSAGAVRVHGASATGPEAQKRVEERHGQHFASLPDAPRASVDYGRWRRLMSLELDNLIAAADRAAGRDDEVLLRAGDRALAVLLATGPYGMAETKAREWRAAAESPVTSVTMGLRQAHAHTRRGRAEDAMLLAEELVREAEDAGDNGLLVDALSLQGSSVVGSARSREGLAMLQRAQVLAQELRDRRREGDVLSVLGMLQSSHGDQESARVSLEKARHLLRSTSQHEGEVKTLINLSVVYRGLGLEMLLEGTLQEALRRSREISFDPGVVVALLNLAVRWQETGRLQDALDAYIEALAMARRHGDLSAVPLLHANIGDVYRELGELDEALEQTAISMRSGVDSVGHRGRAGILLVRADVLAATRRDAEAEQALRRALELSEESGAQRHIIDSKRRLGALMARRNALEEAAEVLAEARALAEVGRAGASSARVYADSAEVARRQGEHEVASHWLDLADEHTRACDDRIYKGIVACRRAVLERDMGNLDAARELLASATHIVIDLALPVTSELARAINDVRVTL